MFTENLTPFFADFGVDATLDGAPVRVIFDKAYIEPYSGIATNAPMATVPSTSAAAATQASLLVLSGTTYRVRGLEPDGTGITTLRLEKQ